MSKDSLIPSPTRNGLQGPSNIPHVGPLSGGRMTETDTTNSDALFLRAASGLTRLMSGWDVFIYNLGLICIGMNVAYTQRAGPAYYPNCSIGKATILAAACSIAVALGFWAWTSAAPRSGGIYVYLTRAGLPAIGFAVSFAECI